MSTMSPITPASPIRMSGDEFLKRYAGRHAELVDGVVKEYPMAGLNHGMICITIGALILAHVRAHGLGRVMSNDSWVRIGPETYRGADVLFYSYSRLPKDLPVPDSIHTLAPELVVEVKSPTDRWGEIFVKVGEYLNAGVLVVIVIDPGTATVSVHRDQARQHILEPADTLTVPDVLPGFSVPVASIFE